MKRPVDSDIWDNDDHDHEFDIDDHEQLQGETVCNAHGVPLPCPLTPGCQSILRLTLEDWFTNQGPTERNTP